MIDEPDLDSTIIQDRVMTACMNQQEFGENSCVFYDICLLKMKQEHELNAMFRGALENGDFKVYFQPKVSLEDEKPRNAEALVRWQHPEEGMISRVILSLCLKNGNICRLDCYVFEEVCRTIDRWRREGRKLFPVSVNLSGSISREMIS